MAGLPAQSEPLLNWKLKEFAEHRRDSDPNDLRNDTDPPPVVPEIPPYPDLHEEAAPRWAALSAKARANDTDLIVPAAQRARYEAAFARFASVFPDAFYVSERGRYFPDDSEDKGRLLSAGYHNIMGYYRDDLPLMQLILDDNGKKELDRLWNEFDYIADFSARTWTQYYFNQSGEVFGKGDESGSDAPDRSRRHRYRSHLQDARHLPGQGRGRSHQRPRSGRGHSRSLRPDERHAPQPGKGAGRGGTEATGSSRSNLPRVPTAGPSPMRNAPICWPITTRIERKISYPTKTPSAMRSPAC